MKIAVIGSGISGLASALLLSEQHEVTLFEKDTRLGGHSNTIDISFPDKRVSVDTGFMVYNPEVYTHFTKLLEYLGVPTKPTTMSFSVSLGDGFEYSSIPLKGVFADTQNFFRPSFYRFLIEIIRFNRVALQELSKTPNERVTLEEFLARHSFSSTLKERHLIPMVGSIWSTPKELVTAFPASALLSFLKAHKLLRLVGQPKWRTIEGGSRTYVERIEKILKERGATIVLDAALEYIERGEKARVVTKHGTHEFDRIVIATHADEALELLKDPSANETRVLSGFTYETNDVVVHSDESLMPKRKNAWASWNYLDPQTPHAPKKVTLTYWMNSLQSINKKYPIFITLNPVTKPKAETVHTRLSYAHPLYTLTSAQMKKELVTIQDKNKTLFVGSYFGYGFHEDGLLSAIEASRYCGCDTPWKL